jgi:hypothetical protein
MMRRHTAKPMRFEQRVVTTRRGWHPEGAQHRGIARAEGEIHDAPVVVAHRPQDPHCLGEAVEQGPKLRGTLRTEEVDELRVLSPRLGIEGVPFGHGQQDRSRRALSPGPTAR